MKKKLSGVMPALVTPFDAKGEVDFKAFEKLLTMLRDAGVTGWVPCGSTGEYSFMSDEERDAVLKFVKDFAKPDETLIAGTNAPHTKGVIANTKRAKAIGYDTVLLAVPFYTKPSQQEIITHFKAVLDAVDVNIVLYSYPGKDGVEIGFDVLDALADHPRVIGIKESSGVLQRAIEIFNRYEGRLQLVSGSDDAALDLRACQLHGQGLLRPRSHLPVGRHEEGARPDGNAVHRHEHPRIRKVRSEGEIRL